MLFSFTSNNIVFNNIYERLYVCLLQNGRWIDAHCNIKPTYMKDNIVYFDESAKILQLLMGITNLDILILEAYHTKLAI